MPKFSDLKAEALAKVDPKPPFVLELDDDEPIEITRWDDLERDIGLSELIGPNGEFLKKDQRKILQFFCGDAFDRVWELCRREHSTVMTELVNQLILHFKDDLDPDAANAPGGSKASST